MNNCGVSVKIVSKPRFWDLQEGGEACTMRVVTAKKRGKFNEDTYFWLNVFAPEQVDLCREYEQGMEIIVLGELMNRHDYDLDKDRLEIRGLKLGIA